MTRILLAIFVVIVLIYVSYRYGHHKSGIDLLTGFWESDTGFNKESGINSFTFYIGEKISGQYPAYLLMIESGEPNKFLINEPISLTIEEPLTNILSRVDYREFYMCFHEMESGLIPKKIMARIYPQSGKLVLSHNNKIYGVLFKNLILTEMENIKRDLTDNTNINKAEKINDTINNDNPESDCDDIESDVD